MGVQLHNPSAAVEVSVALPWWECAACAVLPGLLMQVPAGAFVGQCSVNAQLLGCRFPAADDLGYDRGVVGHSTWIGWGPGGGRLGRGTRSVGGRSCAAARPTAAHTHASARCWGCVRCRRHIGRGAWLAVAVRHQMCLMQKGWCAQHAASVYVCIIRSICTAQRCCMTRNFDTRWSEIYIYGCQGSTRAECAQGV